LSNIRVTYSGLIAFTVTLIGVVTGTIFIIIVTRRLDPADFGLWTLIGSLVSYVTIIEPIVTFWTTRQIARGEKAGKTAIATSGLFSIVGLGAYTAIALYVSATLGSDLNILLLASFLIPISFMNNILNSICAGFRPQSIPYGILSFEITKIPLGYLLVIAIPMGIIGVLIATIIANAVKMSLLLIQARSQLFVSFKRSFAKFWLRMSWLTLYMSIHGFIYKLDVLIFSLVTGSLVGLAFWGVASAASNFVGYSGTISQGLFPKILATGKKEFAQDNLKKSLYFAIPLVGFSVVFAKPALHILNPFYIDGAYIVGILAIRLLVNVITGFCFGVLESFERVDLDKQASFKQFLHSRIFVVPTLWLIYSIIYVSSLSVFLILFWTPEMLDSDTVTVWALILLVVNTPFMIYGLVKVKKSHNIDFPFKDAAKYIGTTIIAVTIIQFLIENTLTYPPSIWEFIPEVLPLVFLGAGIYFGISYIIDKTTRKLFRSIINELIKKRNNE